MQIGNRILQLRKMKGISQEELADQLCVSRQAVSKWESEQSMPELDKILLLSDYFQVTTDYLIKGIESEKDEQKSHDLTSKILYIASVTFVIVGLLSAFAGWYQKQTMEVICGSMIIQAVGIAGYFIGKLLSPSQPSFVVNELNVLGCLFMPISMLSGVIARNGFMSPYPVDVRQMSIFLFLYGISGVISYILLKSYPKKLG